MGRGDFAQSFFHEFFKRKVNLIKINFEMKNKQLDVCFLVGGFRQKNFSNSVDAAKKRRRKQIEI